MEEWEEMDEGGRGNMLRGSRQKGKYIEGKLG